MRVIEVLRKTVKKKTTITKSLFLGLSLGVVLGALFFLLARILKNVLKQPRFISRAIVTLLEGTHQLEARAHHIAKENLLTGIERRLLPGGQEKLVLVAGLRNFREPWARDFGFAINGLLALQEYEAIRECLEVFFLTQRPDGQFPIKIHSTNVPSRYLHSLFQRQQPIISPLRPKYTSGHNTISLDGNGLLVIAALNYAKVSGDHGFIRDHWDALVRAVDWLGNFGVDQDGLLQQGVYSDWADSIAREGRVLYTNMIYWKALMEISEAAARHGTQSEQDALRDKARLVYTSIHEHFWRPDLGFFVTNKLFENLNASGNLMAIAWGLTTDEQAHSILDAMRDFGMADPVPTKPVHTPYPLRYVAFENRLGGIAHYHTDAAWLWLGAWHVIAMACVGRLDEADQLLSRMAKVIVRDGEVHEVYGTDGRFISNFWYTSEAPLTWSAGMFVYAYHMLEGMKEKASS